MYVHVRKGNPTTHLPFVMSEQKMSEETNITSSSSSSSGRHVISCFILIISSFALAADAAVTGKEEKVSKTSDTPNL